MSRITDWIAGGLDPVRLARDLKMTPDPWQRKVLRSTAPRLHLNCSRQVGKSTVTSLVALHRALYVPDSTVLIISPSDRQSGELFLKVRGCHAALGKPLDPAQENVHLLRLENGSRILSLPASESNIRGFTADLLLIDEAAYVGDALYQSVSPMLAVSGGRLVAMSTPAGKRGWWYEASASDQWERVRVPASTCPRIPKDFLDGERERLGDAAFRSEYMCEFTDASGAAFSGADIDALFGGTAPEPVSLAAVRRGGDDLHASVQRFVSRRAGRGTRLRTSMQRRCDHRWSPDGSYCVFCAAERPAC